MKAIYTRINRVFRRLPFGIKAALHEFPITPYCGENLQSLKISIPKGCDVRLDTLDDGECVVWITGVVE